MQDQYLKLPRLNPDALSRCERLLRDWESMAGTDNSVDGCAEELRAALYQTGAATMADVELLPLPEGYDKYDPPLLYDGQMFVEGQMRSYARACVAHAIAAKDAEIDTLRTLSEDTVRDSTNKIEALRAEVERSERYAEQSERERLWAEARAERLAEEVERMACELVDAITRADKLAEALRRYRNEVPIGHQPHMLAHEVDDLLREQEEGK